MSEKSEVQNLDDPAEATEALDPSPAAADAGHVAQGEPKEYGEESAESVDELRDHDPQEDR